MKQQIELLESKVEDLNRQNHMNHIEIRNIPSQPHETYAQLLSITQSTLSAIKADVKDAELLDIRRLPGKPDQPRPVLVHLLSTHAKDKILQSVRIFNLQNKSNKLNSSHIGLFGSPSPIYVAEHLTPKARKLFFLARELARVNKYQFCWTSRGKVFLRREAGSTLITIADEQEINKLKTQNHK